MKLKVKGDNSKVTPKQKNSFVQFFSNIAQVQTGIVTDFLYFTYQTAFGLSRIVIHFTN